jgi:hypothetical protein
MFIKSILGLLFPSNNDYTTHPHGQQVVHPTKPGDIQLQYRVPIYIGINVSSNAVYADRPDFFIFFARRFSFNVFCAFFFISFLVSRLFPIHYPSLKIPGTPYSIPHLSSCHETKNALVICKINRCEFQVLSKLKIPPLLSDIIVVILVKGK